MNRLMTGFSTVTSNIKYGASALGDTMAGFVGTVAERVLDTGFDAYDAVIDTQTVLSRGKLRQVGTQFAGSVVGYMVLSSSENDSPETSMLKTAVAAGYVLYNGYNITQGRRYTTVQEAARDTALLVGATALAVAAPGVVTPTTSWLMGGDAAKKLVGAETPLTADKANEFGAGVVTSIVVPGGGFVIQQLVNAAASKALPRLVSGDRPAMNGLRDQLALVNTGIHFLRNPMAQVKAFADSQVAAFLNNMLPAISSRLPAAVVNTLASHGVQITMNGFVPFMEKMGDSGAVLLAKKAFQEDPSEGNLMALKAAMKDKLQGFVFNSMDATLQSTVEGVADNVTNGLLQQIDAFAESMIGFSILSDRQKAYFKGMASAFLGAYVPYLIANSASLMEAMSRQNEQVLLNMGMQIAQEAVAQVSPVLSLAVPAAQAALNGGQNLVHAAAGSPDAIAIEAPSGPVVRTAASGFMAILLYLFAALQAAYAKLFPPIRVAKIAPGPAQLVEAETPRIKLSSLSQLQKLSLVSAAAIA